MTHEPRVPLMTRARRLAGIVALAVGVTVFYLAGLSAWSIVGDPSGGELLVALLATILAGNLLARYYGLV